MSWLLPLAAISAIQGFDNTAIPSQDHYQRTADSYASIWPWRSYKTSPHMPPHMEIERLDSKLWDGYIFLTPADQKTKRGTYELSGTGFIMTDDGDLVFAGEENGYNFCDEWVAGMTDFRVQEYKGQPFITYWNGCNKQGAHWGHRWGRVTFIDQEYTNFTINPEIKINTLDSANRGQIDVHEHEMTGRDSMVVSTYNNTQTDLTSVGGEKDGWIAESMFVEIDIETQKILFEWRAADHVSLAATKWPLRGRMGQRHFPWDWFHINSVQRVGENYLISSRHHWAVYLISGKDGSVMWKLDGENGGSFSSIPSRFRWQHHARAQNVTKDGMSVSLFNNHVQGPSSESSQSQALAFWLPLPPNKNTPPQLVRKLMTDSKRVFAATQGSYQLDLGNGNGFVGYGKIPLAREYGPDADGSDLRWQARFGRNDAAMSYRTFKAKWHGTPKNWDPVVAFEKVRLQKSRPPKVYVSWNGATDISGWAVYAGDDKDNLKSVGIAKKKGFETVFDLDSANCVQLGAIRDAEIIRASNIACVEEVEEDSEPLVTLPPIDDDYDTAIQADVADLQAEKERLEVELEGLQDQLDDMEAETWSSYRLFAEVACAAVLIVAGSWGFILWRDWRRRDQGFDTFQKPVTLASTLGLGRLSFGRPKWTSGTRGQVTHAEEFRDLGRHHMRSESDRFALSDGEDDDEGSKGPNARTPFIRQSTAT